MRPSTFVPSGLVAVLGCALAACQEDPQYMEAVVLEAMPGAETPATASVFLPIELESERDLAERTALAEDLMMPADQVPYVRVDDLDVSLEFTVRNLSDRDGQAFVNVNGGNQYFFYVPEDFVVDPDEDEPPPPLMGGVPIDVAAGERISDVIREDEVREASIDLELITRGGLHPAAAILAVHEDLDEWQPVALVDPEDPGAGTMPVGEPISVRAFGQIVRFDVTFEADTQMILQMAIRVRDHRSIVHEALIDAPPEELVRFMPAQFTPAGGAP